LSLRPNLGLSTPLSGSLSGTWPDSVFLRQRRRAQPQLRLGGKVLEIIVRFGVWIT